MHNYSTSITACQALLFQGNGKTKGILEIAPSVRFELTMDFSGSLEGYCHVHLATRAFFRFWGGNYISNLLPVLQKGI